MKTLSYNRVLAVPCKLVVLAATLIVPSLLTPSALALDFDYAKIADGTTTVPGVGGTFSTFGSAPSLDALNLAFTASRSSPTFYSAVYLSSGGTLTKKADTNTAVPSGSFNFSTFGAAPSLTGTQFAFNGVAGAQSGIYMSDLSRVADINTPIPNGSGTFTNFTAPSFDGNAVVFGGNGSNAQNGIFSSAGGIHTVANTATAIPSGSGTFTVFALTPPSANGGAVAFEGSGNSGQSGVYTNVGGTLHVVADTNTQIPSGIGNFTNLIFGQSLDNGNVAFIGQGSGGQSGVYTDAGGLSRVADLNTPFPGGTGNFTNFFNDAMAIDNGDVAFQALGNNSQRGVFINHAGLLSTVVTNVSAFDGKQVSNFVIGPEGLSNGNIAFSTSFADGSQGIYVAEQSYDYAANASGTWDTASSWGFGLRPRTVLYTNIHPTNGVVVTGPSSATTIRGLDLGATTSGQAELRLQASGQLTANEYMYVQSLGKLSVNGGVASAALGIYNYGDVDLGNGGQTSGGTLQNSGTLHGTGTVGNLVYNYSRIQAIGTQMTFTQGVYNFVSTASIQARNALLQFNGGLSNAGSLDFSFGTSDVFGAVTNVAADPMAPAPGGQIIVSGNSNVTFYDPVVHNGDVFRVSTGSTAVFFGHVSGAGAFTGGGAKLFEGGYSPGNSPAAVSLDGTVTFGDTNTVTIELGGTTVGTQYDHISIAGQLALGGKLQVLKIDLNNGFAFAAGQSFDILDWGSLSGTFAALQLPALSGSLAWNTSRLYTAGVLSVGLPGDFNGNGTVDGADYVLWRKGLGTTYTQNDYAIWRANFGATAGSGSRVSSNTAVPEPTSLLLLFMGMATICSHRRMAGASTR